MGSYRGGRQSASMAGGKGGGYNANPSLRQQQMRLVPSYVSPRTAPPVQTASSGKGGGKGGGFFGQFFDEVAAKQNLMRERELQTYNPLTQPTYAPPPQMSSRGGFAPPPPMGFYGGYGGFGGPSPMGVYGGFGGPSFYGAFANPYSYDNLGRGFMPMVQPFSRSNQGYQNLIGNQPASNSYQTTPEPLPTAPIASPPAQEMTLLSNPPVAQPKGFLSGQTVTGLGPSAFNPARRTQMSAFGSMRNPFNMFTSFIR